MSSVTPKIHLTPEQYLAMERQAEFKHEYDRGRIIAMARASREHNLIAANVARLVGNQLVDRPCETYVSDLRVRVGPSGPYTYPDVVVACGEPRFEDDEFDTLLNPTLIVEVLSPPTERRDRGRKFIQYRSNESLQEYVLIAQDQVHVERHVRRGREWVLADESDDLNATLHLEAIGCDLPIRQIYARVTFPETPEDRSGQREASRWPPIVARSV